MLAGQWMVAFSTHKNWVTIFHMCKELSSLTAVNSLLPKIYATVENKRTSYFLLHLQGLVTQVVI